jgi:2'-5' RNA ligase
MAQSLNTYGVFLIPPENICQRIQEIKKTVEFLDSNATYLNHPVHSTIFVFNSSLNAETISEYFGQVLANFKKIDVQTSGWQIFYNDILTHKHTITIGLVGNEALSNLQCFVADSLFSLSTEPISYKVDWEGQYLTSYKKWGYPFVGNHWIPHLTIASVQSETSIQDIKNEQINIPETFVFSSIALFLIDGDQHTILHSIDL